MNGYVPFTQRHGAAPVVSMDEPADPFAPFYEALERYFEAEDRALMAAFGHVERDNAVGIDRSVVEGVGSG